MIVLQNSTLPLSTDFFIEKKTPIFKMLTFEHSNWSLSQQNADCHRLEITFEASKGTLFLQSADFSWSGDGPVNVACSEILNMEKIETPL